MMRPCLVSVRLERGKLGDGWVWDDGCGSRFEEQEGNDEDEDNTMENYGTARERAAMVHTGQTATRETWCWKFKSVAESLLTVPERAVHCIESPSSVGWVVVNIFL